MPPRKSNVSVVSTTADEASMLTDAGADSKSGDASKVAARKKKEDTTPTSAEQTQLGIDEFMMPRMMTVRLAKGVLPPHTLIHRDAATALQYAASVFLNHVAAAANEHTLGAQRKNISPQDMLAGLRDTEWAALVPQLEDELAIYVRTINDKRNEYRRKLKERDSLGGASTVGAAAAAAEGTAAMTADTDDAAAAAGGGNGDEVARDPTSGAGVAVYRGPDSQLLGEDSMMSRITAGEDEEEEEEEDEEAEARTGTPATERRDGPDGPRTKKARLGEGVKQAADEDEDEDEDMLDEEEEEEEEEDEGDDEEEEEEDEEGEEGEDDDEEKEEELDRTSNRDEDEDEEGSDEESD